MRIHMDKAMQKVPPRMDKKQDGMATDRLSTVDNSPIRNFDVLCGRGKESYNHAGNQYFRQLVAENVTRYSKCDIASERSKMVLNVIEMIKSNNGRFLKNRQGKNDTWAEMTTQHCKDKVAHAMRDASNLLMGKTTRRRRQSTLISSESDDQVDLTTSQNFGSNPENEEISETRSDTLSRLLPPISNSYRLEYAQRLTESFSFRMDYQYAATSTGCRYDPSTTTNAYLPASNNVSNVDQVNSEILRRNSIGFNTSLKSTRQKKDFPMYLSNMETSMKTESKHHISDEPKILGNSNTSDPSFIVPHITNDESDDCISLDSFVKDIDDTLGPLHHDGTDPINDVIIQNKETHEGKK